MTASLWYLEQAFLHKEGDFMKNRVKDVLKRGGVVIGSFVGLNCPDLVEIMGLSGFDFCIIDTEHGPMNPESIQHMIRTAELSGMTPIVRVTQGAETDILRVLDVGAQGIHVPQVNDCERAKKVAAWSKYFPEGTRGVALPRALGYGLRPLTEAMKEVNEETLVITHCENVACLDCLHEIACLDGIDLIFVGPYDLSQSLGIPGQIDHPLMKETVARVLRITREAGKPAGIFVTSVDEALRRIEEGFQYIAYSIDMILFSQICKQTISDLKKK